MGVGGQEAGYAVTDTGDTQVGGRTHEGAGAVLVVSVSVWDWGAGVETGGRGRLEKWVRKR